MEPRDLLFKFENKYRFLYDIEVNGVPVYTCLRDGVFARLQGNIIESTSSTNEKGKIFIKRIIDSAMKLYRFRKKNTLIFTSSVYRRDKGRNLAAEYLMDRYPNAVVFEWPSRNTTYDAAYFVDENRDKYCPLELYLVIYKLYIRLHRNKYNKLCKECKRELVTAFAEHYSKLTEQEEMAIEYLIETMPDLYATTIMSQEIFGVLFRKYDNVEYAIDFWGSARENIIPVLPGKPQSVELQHGIITSSHPGYMYPEFLKESESPLFKRKLLIYGQETKAMLGNSSIFREEQIEVIGNPRITIYKKEFMEENEDRKLILFASQPFEQDGVMKDYYDTVIPILKRIETELCTKKEWKGYLLGIKLHPREDNEVRKLYEQNLKEAIVFDNTSQLYELLNQTVLHLTVSSTTLYEAALFGAPTVTIMVQGVDSKNIYGFETWVIKEKENVITTLERCLDNEQCEEYLGYLKKKTIQYM